MLEKASDSFYYFNPHTRRATQSDMSDRSFSNGTKWETFMFGNHTNFYSLGAFPNSCAFERANFQQPREKDVAHSLRCWEKIKSHHAALNIIMLRKGKEWVKKEKRCSGEWGLKIFTIIIVTFILFSLSFFYFFYVVVLYVQTNSTFTSYKKMGESSLDWR